MQQCITQVKKIISQIVIFELLLDIQTNLLSLYLKLLLVLSIYKISGISKSIQKKNSRHNTEVGNCMREKNGKVVTSSFFKISPDCRSKK